MSCLLCFIVHRSDPWIWPVSLHVPELASFDLTCLSINSHFKTSIETSSKQLQIALTSYWRIMATIERVEQRMKASYNFNNPQDGWMYQDTVDEFLELLRNGQLHKGKHSGLFDQFVNWVQEDEFWELALPIAPELRENKVEEW